MRHLSLKVSGYNSSNLFFRNGMLTRLDEGGGEKYTWLNSQSMDYFEFCSLALYLNKEMVQLSESHAVQNPFHFLSLEKWNSSSPAFWYTTPEFSLCLLSVLWLFTRDTLPLDNIWIIITFLGNCPPTPPLSQHFTPSEKSWSKHFLSSLESREKG